jgi:SAM-dependent methyltransferase
MTETNCEVCSQSTFKFLFKKDKESYQQCVSCGLVRIYPQPTNQRLNEIYNEQYPLKWGDDEDAYRPLKLKLNRMILNYDKLTESVNEKRKLLDIGAATGMLMETAEQFGYEVYGVEIGDSSVATLQKKFGTDRVFKGWFDQMNVNECGGLDFFDTVTMIDVLEHVRDPNRTLDQINKIVKKGSRVLCYLPNTASLTAKLLGSRWEFYCTQHLFSFAPNNLKILFEKHGFEILTSQPSPRYVTIEYARIAIKYALRGGICEWFLPALNHVPKCIARIIFPCYGNLTVVAQKK